MSHRIYIPGPQAAGVQTACRDAGLNATIRELRQDTIVTVYAPDGWEAASIRLTSEPDSETGEYTHTVICTQATAVSALWRVLSEVITANVAF